MCTTAPHPRGFQDALLSAQLDLGDALSQAIGGGRCDRAAYLRWLVAEHALCRAGARTLDWLRPLLAETGTQAWLASQAHALHEATRLAAADLGGDADVPTEPAEVDHWAAFLMHNAGSRPYRVLGAIALQAVVTGGAARAALAAMLEQRGVAASGHRYLVHRQARNDEDAPSWFGLWQSLPDGDARLDAIDGAMRTVEICRLVFRASFPPSADASREPRWTWPNRQDAA